MTASTSQSGLEVFTTWPAVVALALILLFGQGGVVYVFLRARDQKLAQTQREQTAESVQLHRAAFDGSVDELESRLSAKVDAVVKPLADQHARTADLLADLGRDVRGIRADVGELRASDRDQHQRLNALERPT